MRNWKNLFLALITLTLVICFTYLYGDNLWKVSHPNFSGSSHAQWISQREILHFSESNKSVRSETCRMDSCFEFSHCSLNSGFPLYFYTSQDLAPLSKGLASGTKDGHSEKIYGIQDRERACVFVVVLRNEKEDISPETLKHAVESLPKWNGGSNHVLINLATSANTFSFAKVQTARAVLAQSTFLSDFRQNYDIIIPPSPGTESDDVWSKLPPIFPAHRKYLVSFWGEFLPQEDEKNQNLEKEVTSILQNLGKIEKNGYEVQIKLSCEGSQSSGLPSEWTLCGQDGDRNSLLSQSTFSLILPPLNPTLVSTFAFQTRLQEALKQGAVPVILGHTRSSLPFGEILHWENAALIYPLHRLSDLWQILVSFSDMDILEFRRHGRFLWETYFSSSGRIVDASLAVLRFRLGIPAAPFKDVPTVNFLVNSSVTKGSGESGRISSRKFQRNFTKSLEMWSFNHLGAPFYLLPSTPFEPALPGEAKFREEWKKRNPPFDTAQLGGNVPQEQFTVVILTYKREASLMAVLNRLNGMAYLNKVLVVWNDPAPPSPSLSWPRLHVPLVVTPGKGNSLNNRFLPFDTIETDCVFSMDDDIVLSQTTILQGFRTWRSERDRMVGFFFRGHSWSPEDKNWKYGGGKSPDSISMIITNSAFFHKYYLYLYSYTMPKAIRDFVDKNRNCEDIAMSSLVAHVTRKPAIKMPSQLHQDCPKCRGTLSSTRGHYEERRNCVNYFAKVYGYQPLLYTP